MDVIVVEGKKNTGKTNLVNYVFETLKRYGAEVIFYKKIGAHFEDFMAVVMWKGKTIALCSHGDDCSERGKKKDDYIKSAVNDLFSFKKDYDGFIGVKNKEFTELEYENILAQYFKEVSYSIISVVEYQQGGGYPSMKQKQEKCEEILNLLKTKLNI